MMDIDQPVLGDARYLAKAHVKCVTLEEASVPNPVENRRLFRVSAVAMPERQASVYEW